MTLGIVMLVHDSLHRTKQVARHWTAAGCPVVLHVDSSVSRPVFTSFRSALTGNPLIRFSERHRCEWGTWGIVQATQAASELMLNEFPQVRHVYLASGTCLPLRPVRDLAGYLDARPRTDFIESVTAADVPWTVGGLDRERFTLRFPFSWKRNRRLFDRYVALQRKLGLKRRLPPRLVPHLGSQWWCLTRQTLSAILQDPERPAYDRYFSKVWIPDESYFQSMVRLYSSNIESRSLTLSKFDFQGKPHVFYDDHLQLLRRSDCFVARKIWPRAEELYRAFLTDDDSRCTMAEPNPGRIDKVFAAAVTRRTKGRPGLRMQSRIPSPHWDGARTNGPYTVFQGFDALFTDFRPWLAKQTGAQVHGRLFAPDRAHFAGGEPVIDGALSDNAAARDYDPAGFLSNLIWNTRGNYQCFQFGPEDWQAILKDIARDANARFVIVSGAWAIPLFLSNGSFGDLRRSAARLQQIERNQLDLLRVWNTKADVQLRSLTDFIAAPMEFLRPQLDQIAPGAGRALAEVPQMVDMTGFGQFVQNLRNQGMQPYLIGDFPLNSAMQTRPDQPNQPYAIR